MVLQFNLVNLHRVMKDFYTLTKIRIVLIDAEYNEKLSYPKYRFDFCSRIRKNVDVEKKCNISDMQGCRKSAETKEAYIYCCHAGLVEAFAEHLKFVKNNIKEIDEIALFAEYCHHGYWELEQQRQVAEILKKRIRQYKECGVKSVGINVLCTLGHLEEAWDVLPTAPFQHMVGRNGEESKSCICPSDKEFLKYIYVRYRILASAEPDFIWTDDDIRLYSHGKAWDGCYCEHCMEAFNQTYGFGYYLQDLTEELEKDQELHEKWNMFRNSLIKELLITIRNAVKGIKPSIEMGYMSTGEERSGAEYTNACREWMEALGAEKGRPGGGFYKDDRPLELFEKVYRISTQLKEYPKTIRDLQYEFENFNYQTLGKAMTLAEIESTAALMYGCNGIAFNDMVFNDNPKLLKMVQRATGLWERLCRENQKYFNAGVYCASIKTAHFFNEIGIPVTCEMSQGSAAVILGDEWEKLTGEQAKKLMGKNVLTDGRGLERLWERGLGHLCGGRVKNSYTNGMAERFTEHPVNGKFANYYRDVFMTFFHPNICHTFETADTAECLAKLETIRHHLSDCSMYLFCNELGGRICVDGYLMPDCLKSEAKRGQILNVLEYLSCGKLPVKMEQCQKVIPIVRASGDGKMRVMLTNASLDPTEEFECMVRNDKEFYQIGNRNEKLPVRQRKEESNRILALSLGPWEYAVLSNE